MTMASAMSRRRTRSRQWAQGLARRLLRVPLIAKLIGTNVVIVAAAVSLQMVVFRGQNDSQIAIIVAGLTAASVISFVLVRVALQPVDELEHLAERVLAGNFNVRVPRSPFADAALSRLAGTVNGLLDSLAAERKRIQELGAEVVYAQDAERAHVSRELHDSIAQTLAAVRFQLAAAGAESTGELRNRLAAASELVGSAMEEVKKVSYSFHPRVAVDLGLEAALETLARQVETRSGIEVRVTANVTGAPIPSKLAATLFRVAQEALRNIEMHSQAKSATVDVESHDGSIRIEVADDGRGFDTSVVVTPAFKSALASVKDRVTLAGGVLTVDSVPNGGTRVIAELKGLKAAS
jgi:signal transduction histidine kinase